VGYNEIFFDLDGTIIHSEEGICNALRYTLEKKGVSADGLGDLTRFIGPPLYESFVTRFGLTPEQAADWVTVYREYYAAKGVYEYKVIPGMDSLIKELKGQGKKLYLATGKPQDYAAHIVRALGLADAFDGIVGSNMDGTRLTKNEVLADTLTLAGSAAPVLVGDTVYDVAAANTYGIDSVAVAFGYGNAQELAKEKPTYLAETVKDLRRILL
jgi:phosphoglycolate phosphatase